MLDLQPPIIYQITSGSTTAQTTPNDPSFISILDAVQVAVGAGVSLFQIREKALSGRVLYELTARAAEFTRGSSTRLLVNDRSDVAHAAAADGVHLTSQSLPARVVRETYGSEFVIGVSTHSSKDVLAAREAGADFVVFGPVFETESKLAFGPPQGLKKLHAVAHEAGSFPVIAIGGISLDNMQGCFEAGAHGVAAIRMFQT